MRRGFTAFTRDMAATIKSLASILEGFAPPETSTHSVPAAPKPEAEVAAERGPGGEAEASANGDQPLPAESGPIAAPAEPSPVKVPSLRRSEIELKLLVDPERLAGFNDAPVVVAHTRNKGTVRNLTAVYYDTPGRALFRAGFTLNVRRSGQRFVQTVKIEPQRGGDPLWRGEWETPVSSMAPDLGSVMPLVPPHVRSELERTPLQPMFTSRIRRHLRTFALPTGLVEMAFDRGQLEAGGRAAPVSEIELEVKEGSREVLYDLALRLSEHGALRPATRSKAERGFDLALDVPPAVRKPPKIRLNPVASVDEAFATILRSSLYHLLDSQPAAEDGREPEGVHQLRVALRRLRSALALLRKLAGSGSLETFRSDAKWLATCLGEARGWDVFLAHTLPEVAKGCASVDGFALLRDIAEEYHAAAYSQARGALADLRSSRFQIGLGAWIEQRGWRGDVTTEGLGLLAEPAVAFAGRVLERQHRKILKRGKRFKKLTPEARHQLRLAAKKLRYSADFFLPLFGTDKSTKRYVRLLADFQEGLGRYNDMAVTWQLLSRFPTSAIPAASAGAVGAVLGWQARGLAFYEADLRSAWRAFGDAPPPWSQQTGRGQM